MDKSPWQAGQQVDPMDATPIHDRSWNPAARRKLFRLTSVFLVGVLAIFALYQLMAGQEMGIPLTAQPTLMLAEYNYNNGHFSQAIVEFNKLEKQAPSWKPTGDYWIAMAQGHMWTQTHSFPITAMVSDSEEAVQANVLQRTRDLINAKDYDGLEALQLSLLKSRATYANGFWLVNSVYEDLARPPAAELSLKGSAGIAASVRESKRLWEWSRARPKSILARVALAQSLIRSALTSQIRDSSGKVPASLKKFGGDNLASADKVLDSAWTGRKTCPGWYSAKQNIALYQASNPQGYFALSAEAKNAFPGYLGFAINDIFYLFPQWHGQPGDCARYVQSEANAKGGTAGDILYARLANGMRQYYHGDLSWMNFSWPRVDKGFRALMKMYPHSSWVPSAYCATADKMQQYSAMQRLYKTSLASSADIGVWGSRQYFEETRATAFGAHA